jgi:hypothetical protein
MTRIKQEEDASKNKIKEQNILTSIKAMFL